jgi:CxxC motif-containing protein (DUF1111 family)
VRYRLKKVIESNALVGSIGRNRPCLGMIRAGGVTFVLAGVAWLIGLGATSPVGAASVSTRPSATVVRQPNDAKDDALDVAMLRLGGAATVFDSSSMAFGQSAPGLSTADKRAFAVGNNFFNDNWVQAPASTSGRDGLGPLFNAQSCSSCHFKDGRGAPPLSDKDPERGLLFRLSVKDAEGLFQAHPVYGGQLQDRAVPGVPVEGKMGITRKIITGKYADGSTYTLEAPSYSVVEPGYGATGLVSISPRIAPPVFGTGLLEAIPEATIVASSDPDDKNGDGISGRVNRVEDLRTGKLAIGRFGWKANVATLEQQNAGAFAGDVGITSTLRKTTDCTGPQKACSKAASGGSPELDDNKLQRVTFYTRVLAVPAARALTAATVSGETSFNKIGCASCHVGQLTTGWSEAPVLRDQPIRPFTDLLLHDMGPGLADGRPDGLATGTEWRTAPLWGIGLTKNVGGHTRFLHDGRARSLTEAVLWHGGEAQGSAYRFKALTAQQRQDLIAYLESL